MEISSARKQPSVSCVLVNWNGWQDTVNCLDSLHQQDYPRLNVIVVDNGSTNDSVERIRERHPWVKVLLTGKNLGFPSGCNVGTRAAYAAGADYIWLLNNDTAAPPDTATKLVNHALENPQVGAVGGVLYYMHDPSQVQAWGGGEINLWTAFVRHFTAPAVFSKRTYLTGACMLVPRSVCEKVGIFYEGFFMYCDDSDLCLRLHEAGFSLAVAEDTAVLHKEGGSAPKQSPVIDEFATTSTLRLLRRHAPLPWLSQFIYIALRLGNRLRRGQASNFAAVLRGTRTFLRERNRNFNDQLAQTSGDMAIN